MTTDWIDIGNGDLNATQLAQVVTNFATSAARAVDGDVLPVTPMAAGEPCCGWLTALRVSNGTLQGKVRWLKSNSFEATELVLTDLVDPTTAARRGVALLEVVVRPTVRLAGVDVFDRLLSRHAADLETEPTTEGTTMSPEQIINNAAENVAKRAGISLTEATRRVRAAAQRPIGANVQLAKGGAPSHCLPAPGTVKDVATARLWLSANIFGFENFSNDDRFHAARALVRICNDATLTAQLARRPNDGKPVVLLAVYPGANATARAKAYLAGTVENWNQLSNDDQFNRAVNLKRQAHIIDQVAA